MFSSCGGTCNSIVQKMDENGCGYIRYTRLLNKFSSSKSSLYPDFYPGIIELVLEIHMMVWSSNSKESILQMQLSLDK